MTKQEAIEWLEFMREQEHAKGALSPTPCNTEIALQMAINAMKQPEIVRCRDCIWQDTGKCLNDNIHWQIEDCGCYSDFITDLDWYCAEGEKG